MQWLFTLLYQYSSVHYKDEDRWSSADYTEYESASICHSLPSPPSQPPSTFIKPFPPGKQSRQGIGIVISGVVLCFYVLKLSASTVGCCYGYRNTQSTSALSRFLVFALQLCLSHCYLSRGAAILHQIPEMFQLLFSCFGYLIRIFRVI